MIDWHSHVLPQMDDGSQSAEESSALLRMLSAQGVDVVIATPHYYAEKEGLCDFLMRRERSVRILSDRLSQETPRILLGAEVRYYSGISAMENIRALCIEGTSLLLLEMPFARWTEYTVREVLKLSHHQGITVVLAHIERYLSLQDKSVWKRLEDSGVFMQMNAGCFLRFSTKKRALRLLKNGKVQFIGSDCHDRMSRPPRIGSACEVISKRLGERFLHQMNEYGKSFLK